MFYKFINVFYFINTFVFKSYNNFFILLQCFRHLLFEGMLQYTNFERRYDLHLQLCYTSIALNNNKIQIYILNTYY